MTLAFQDPQLAIKIVAKKITTALGVVEFAELGSGPVVICLHGAMGGYDQSLILAQTIAEPGYRYLALSRPGYLGTPISSGRTPEQQGDLIAAVLDVLQIDRAGVLAVSGGGPAALGFGLRHGQRCKGMVLVSTCADKVMNKIPFSFHLMTILARRPGFGKKLYSKAAGNLRAVAQRSIRAPEILERTIQDAETWPLYSTMMLTTYDRMEQRLTGTKNDIRITRKASYPLEALRVPVLIVHGTMDPLVSFEHSAKMYQRRLPDVELLALEGGEHVAIFTHREQARAKVIPFMKRYFS